MGEMTGRRSALGDRKRRRRMLGGLGVLLLLITGCGSGSHRRVARRAQRHDAPGVNAVAFSPDGGIVASGSSDGTVRLWDVRRYRRRGRPIQARVGAVSSVAFIDRRTIAVSGIDEVTRFWDVRTHLQLGRPLPGGYSGGMAVSADGRVLASGSSDAAVRVWNVRTRREVGRPFRPETVDIEGLALSRDGLWLAASGSSASGGGDTMRVWDVRTHRQLGRPLQAYGGASIVFSPDGGILASDSADTTIRLFDVRTHRQLGGPLRGVFCMAFSPDGRTLASGSSDDTIRLWDVRSHRQFGRPLRGHTDTINSLAFSPDGRTVASGSDDDTVRLWDARTHRQRGRPLG